MCGDRGGRPGEIGPTRSFNYDSQGRRVNPQGGYYLIPADQLATVVARMQWDRRVLNCFRFVPLTPPAPPCPPTAARAGVPPRSSFARRR